MVRVWRRFHAAVEREPTARADYEASVAAHGRFNTLKALESALSKRVEFGMADAVGVVTESVRPFGEMFAEFAGVEFPELLQQEWVRRPLRGFAPWGGRPRRPSRPRDASWRKP